MITSNDGCCIWESQYTEISARYILRGRCMMQDMRDFFELIQDELKSKQTANKSIYLTIELEYFNTSASKRILDILLLLEESVLNGADVHLDWRSAQTDADMREAVKGYAELVPGLTFSY